MFAIATQQAPDARSTIADDTQNIRLTDWNRADREKRKIIANIESIEAPDHVDEYLKSEDLIADALYLFDPAMSDEINAAAADHKAILQAGIASVAVSAPDGIRPQEKRKTSMFSIDTGSSDGPRGPFLSYKQRAGQGMADGSWYLRERDGDDWSYSDMTEAMKNGVVADIFATHDGQLGGTLQMGYIKFNEGSAPDRAWWASPLKSEQRPDESKNAGGGFAWQNAMSFRAAIGNGRDAQLDVTGWGGYKGMTALIDLLNSGFAANIGKCPVIQYTGFRVEGTGSKRLHIPEWAVLGWVDRPVCLTPETPTIAPDPTPVAPATPAATAPSAGIPAEAGF